MYQKILCLEESFVKGLDLCVLMIMMMMQLPDVIRGEESCEDDTEDEERSERSERSVERMSAPPEAPGPGLKTSGMSRSVSDTTLRKHALHLNLSQSVLPSFTPLHQFKVCLSSRPENQMSCTI